MRLGARPSSLPLFTELPTRLQAVEKPPLLLSVLVLVQKHLFRGSKARFGASRAGLCSHERAWTEFFNKLVSSRKPKS